MRNTKKCAASDKKLALELTNNYPDAMTLEEMVQESGFKRGWLAKKLGITPQTLSVYVGCHRPLPVHQIKRLAGLLHVSSDDILQAAYGKWL